MKIKFTNSVLLFNLFLFLVGIHLPVNGQQIEPTFDSRFSMPVQTKVQDRPAAVHAGEIIRSGEVTIVIMANEYLFPYGISPDGEHIVISGFGEGGGYYYSQTGGLQSVPGTLYGISADALIAGSFNNPEILYNGNPVNTAGTYDLDEASWTFLGMNPVAPNITIPDYNSGWGIDDAGNKVVGMQYVNGYTLYQAFAWTEAGGYEMIGNQHPLGSRASGINRDGSLVYGWVQPPTTSRSPAVWKDGQLHYVAESEAGEAYAASPNGTYAAGEVGFDAFIWSLGGGTQVVQNTLNSGRISPTIIMDDQTMFGYTNEAWPPFPDARRAFARYSDGTMVTFNEYAEARGMANAEDWIFFSVNAVTPDENQFIGAATNPQGDWVSFLMIFPSDAPAIEITPESITETIDQGDTSTQELILANTGTATLNFSTAIEYTDGSGWLNLNPTWGLVGAGNQITVQVGFNATGLEAGTYVAQIVFNSNDPQSPQVSIPVEMNVNEVCEIPYNLDAGVDANNPNLIQLAWEHAEGNGRAFIGFNIYKDGELLEENWPSNTYSHTEMQINLHCFVVTAVYSICGESEPSQEVCADITVNNRDITAKHGLKLSPNPASNILNLSGLSAGSHIQLYNQNGIIVSDMFSNNKNLGLDISGLSSGYYILVITANDGMVTTARFLKK